jgi:hypothetical protein
MELSEQPLAVKNVEHWPVSQRMIVEMGDYAWSEHIVTIFLAQERSRRLVRSMMRRVAELHNKRGGYTVIEFYALHIRTIDTFKSF